MKRCPSSPPSSWHLGFPSMTTTENTMGQSWALLLRRPKWGVLLPIPSPKTHIYLFWVSPPPHPQHFIIILVNGLLRISTLLCPLEKTINCSLCQRPKKPKSPPPKKKLSSSAILSTPVKNEEKDAIAPYVSNRDFFRKIESFEAFGGHYYF